MFGKICKIWDGLGYKSVNKYESEIKTVRFVNKSSNEDPKYAHEGDSGFDLRAWITENDEGVKKNDKENDTKTDIKSGMSGKVVYIGTKAGVKAAN